jgi:hypothetical protein
MPMSRFHGEECCEAYNLKTNNGGGGFGDDDWLHRLVPMLGLRGFPVHFVVFDDLQERPQQVGVAAPEVFIFVVLK